MISALILERKLIISILELNRRKVLEGDLKERIAAYVNNQTNALKSDDEVIREGTLTVGHKRGEKSMID